MWQRQEFSLYALVALEVNQFFFLQMQTEFSKFLSHYVLLHW